MYCAHHIRNPITFICIAPHRCEFQRKFCAKCRYDHKVDVKQLVSINKFQEIVIKKLKESQLDETPELTKQRMDFKSTLSQTESLLKKIWEELSDSIKQICDMIENQNKIHLNTINQNKNPTELSYTDLEKLVQISFGKRQKRLE